MDITSGTSRYAMYIITFGCAWMIQANVWQRISAARSDRDARKMTVLSFFAYIPLYLIVVLTGVFVPLVAGFVWRRGNAPGAMASMVARLSYCLYNLLISVGVPLPSFWAAQSAQ
ncbi:hypothetical protein [uncultured Subdoligranulum sp.]|uniref:hypothetical protein n=1 Tax=uncultured Subdoligranulum sp. TaxID=512298 RepID=UPI0025E6F14F|nr:hypothetical protein [uncultured Subdoligranulum sp.]